MLISNYFHGFRVMANIFESNKKKMLNARDHCGCTPLHNAIIRNHRGVMLYLINQGADINVQDNIGWFHRFYTILIGIFRVHSFNGSSGSKQ